jgi:hypothetical protein
MASPIAKELERHGIVVIPDLLNPDQLKGMQAAFGARLSRQRWNAAEGYSKTEPHRHVVEDVLVLHQGFMDAALDPRVTDALREYVGPEVQLVEAKGWQSNPTTYDFQQWHGDAWYDQQQVPHIPRQVKLAIYLTDVKSGAFKFIKGSHGQRPPRGFRYDEVKEAPPDQILECLAPAGTGILFDTSGVHRQSIPILEKRRALFYCYHDPSIPLQRADVEYYRYHPMLLNAAFLGNLTEADKRILGFGDKRNYQENHVRKTGHRGYHAAVQWIFDLNLRWEEFRDRAAARARRLLAPGKGEKLTGMDVRS